MPTSASILFFGHPNPPDLSCNKFIPFKELFNWSSQHCLYFLPHTMISHSAFNHVGFESSPPKCSVSAMMQVESVKIIRSHQKTPRPSWHAAWKTRIVSSSSSSKKFGE